MARMAIFTTGNSISLFFSLILWNVSNADNTKKQNNTNFSVEGDGLMVMSIDNLPTELAAESSNHFGSMLSSLIPKMVGFSCCL